jgi:hypothetical protein
MSDNKTLVKINGSDGFGNARVYELPLLTALEGLTLMHDYLSILVNALPQITALFGAWGESEEGDEEKLFDLAAKDLVAGKGPLLDCIQLLPKIVSTPRLLELAELFLARAKVDGEECDGDGMCSIFRGRPHEVYAAIFHGILANFRDYLPFLAADDTADSPSAG